MKGSKPFPVLLLSLCLLLMTACGSSHPPNGPGALSIANTTLPGGVVQSPYGGTSNGVTLGTSGGQAPFTWTLNSGTLPPGLTLSPGGVISGTPLSTDLNSDGTAKTYNFVVKVTDSQTPTAAYQTGAFSIVINPLPLVTSTTLPNGTIGVAYNTLLTNSGGLAPFTWSITVGTLPPGLTLTGSAATISGTPTAGTAGTYPFTIEVTDADSNTATAQVTITITGALQGTFAFSFNGFNNGQPFYTVGSFTGDGTGNVSGILDQNDFANGVSSNVPFTGVFTLGTSNNNLGTLTLNIGAPLNVTYTYTVAVPLQGDLDFVLADSTHPQVYGSGAIKAQTLSKLSLTTLAGNYAFGFFGVDAGGNRSAGAGFFNANSSGNLTSGVEDTNDNGTVQSQVPFMGSAPWAFDPTTGRGVVALTVGANILHYAVYVVNPNTGLVAVQTDPVSSGLSLASWLKQLPGSIGNGNFTNSALNASSVMELNGVSSSGGTPVPDVSLGTSTFDGMGHITFFQIDESNGGNATENIYTTGTYNVESATGRVTVAGLGSGPQPVWYLVNANAGFVIGTDSSVTQGSFEFQSSGSSPASFTLPSFLVSYAGGTIQPVLPSVTNEADSTDIPPPGGTLVVTYDSSGPAGPMLTNPTVMFTYGLGDIVPNSNPPDNTTGKFLLTPEMIMGMSPPPTPSNFCKCNQIVYMVTAVTIPMSGTRDLTPQKWVSINLAVPSTGAADPNPRLTYVRSTFGTF